MLRARHRGQGRSRLKARAPRRRYGRGGHSGPDQGKAVWAAVVDTDPGNLSGAENPEAVDLIRIRVKELPGERQLSGIPISVGPSTRSTASA